MGTENCLVVGLGNIGMGFDFEEDAAGAVLTHCSAITTHPDFSLAGGVDPEKSRRDRFEFKFRAPSFSGIDEALTAIKPSVAIICTPTEHHYSALLKLVASPNLKVIICEKPLSYDFKEALEMTDICERHGIRLYVNYMRRSDPNVIEIKRRIECGSIAAPIKVSAWYSKGILNNGSHLVNLLTYWLDDYIDHNILGLQTFHNTTDPEPDVFIRFRGGTATLLSAWEEFYTHLAVELLSPSGRLYYSNGGRDIRFSRASKDNLFDGYKVLAPEAEIFADSFPRYQYYVYDEISKALRNLKAQLSSGADGLKTSDILRRICGDC